MIFINEEDPMNVKGKKIVSTISRGTLKFRGETDERWYFYYSKKIPRRGTRETHPFLIIHTETTLGLVRSDFYGKPAIRMDIFPGFLLIFQKNSPDFHLSFHLLLPPFHRTISSRMLTCPIRHFEFVTSLIYLVFFFFFYN